MNCLCGWLFGMTTGGVNDGGKGWRLALRHALGDLAQSQNLKPKPPQTVPQQAAKNTEKRRELNNYQK